MKTKKLSFAVIAMAIVVVAVATPNRRVLKKKHIQIGLKGKNTIFANI